MRVHPDKERSIDALLFAVNADGLRDARMCHLMKAQSKADPRCPDVPKETRCAAT
jgi:hypothetical protein